MKKTNPFLESWHIVYVNPIRQDKLAQKQRAEHVRVYKEGLEISRVALRQMQIRIKYLLKKKKRIGHNNYNLQTTQTSHFC